MTSLGTTKYLDLNTEKEELKLARKKEPHTLEQTNKSNSHQKHIVIAHME